MTDMRVRQVFEYGEKEIEYLRGKDAALGAAIDRIGRIEAEVDPDLFSCAVNTIIGQQVSMAAQLSVWRRVQALVGEVTPQAVARHSADELQAQGMSHKKAAYIHGFARKVCDGQFDIDALQTLGDSEVIQKLSSLHGIGVWTAEMLMLFSMRRPNVFSFGDLAILRGLRMLHHHRQIDKARFEKYRRRYSPYCSVASLYLWEISRGQIEGMKDYAPKRKK